MFQHFEWIGHWKHPHDVSPEQEEALFQADMNQIAQDPATKVWWAECEPCQKPFAQWPITCRPPSQQRSDEAIQGDWWAPMECLNHCGHWPTEYASELRYPNHQDRHPNGSWKRK